ncbi:MAG TPA: methyltransferase domain-containing protein [Ilumatobacter sp.]|nr:methyltransferase domain-containing protein [Ilumatobacter sp.]
MRDDAERWNARYADRAPGEPNPPKGLPALELPAGGLCLDVACGLGEQSVWAALNGFDVVALDASDVAVAATRKFAADHGVAEFVDARVHDLDAGLPGDVVGECALVVCQRFRGVDLYPHLAAALAPDGVLVVTVLSEVGLDAEPGPYHAPPGDLSIAFSQLDVDIVSHHEANGEATLVARRRAR